MEPNDIAALRKDYKLHSLNETDLAESPFHQFEHWWRQITDAEGDEFNAMTLATNGTDGLVDARIVLLKAFDENGFVFFTNYNSSKSKQLEDNANCCLLFHWKELERQVRINGVAERISVKESIQYFDSRPEGSKIGAWASPQSLVVSGRTWLEETYHFYKERFKHGSIPKPPHWGGYRVKPNRIEFWQGRPDRMHDRMLYTKIATGEWKTERLAP